MTEFRSRPFQTSSAAALDENQVCATLLKSDFAQNTTSLTNQIYEVLSENNLTQEIVEIVGGFCLVAIGRFRFDCNTNKDIICDVATKLWEHRLTIPSGGKDLERWIKTAARRLAIDFCRARKRAPSAELYDNCAVAHDEDPTDIDPKPLPTPTPEEIARDLAVGELSPIDKEILNCSLENEGEWTTHFEHLGITSNALRVRKNRILARVKKRAKSILASLLQRNRNA